MAICEEKLEKIREALKQLQSIMNKLRKKKSVMNLEDFLDEVENTEVLLFRNRIRKMFIALDQKEQEALKAEYKALGERSWTDNTISFL